MSLLTKLKDKKIEKKDLVIAILVFTIIALLFFAWYFMHRHNPLEGSTPNLGGAKYNYAYSLYDPKNMQRPLGVAVNDEGEVFVADTVNHRIAVFNTQGGFERTIGGPGSGPGQFNYPSSVACFGNKIYVCDFYNQRVQVLDLSGKQLSVIPSPRDRQKVGQVVMPVTITTDKSGNLYISDLSVQRILVFGPDGEFVRAFGKGGANPGELSYVNGIAVDDKQGKIYLANSNNARIDEFTLEGKYVRMLPASKSLINPKGIAFDEATGRLYTADTFAHRVTGIRSDGQLFEDIGTRGVQMGQFNFPTAVAIDSEGKLYVADRDNNRVEVFKH